MVNEYADPVEDSEMNQESEMPVSLHDDGATTEPAQSISTSEERNVIDGLREQLDILENEKLEMFEVMKAKIEHDKVYIKQLEIGVETQRSMLEAKDVEISNITRDMERQHSTLM